MFPSVNKYCMTLVGPSWTLDWIDASFGEGFIGEALPDRNRDNKYVLWTHKNLVINYNGDQVGSREGFFSPFSNWFLQQIYFAYYFWTKICTCRLFMSISLKKTLGHLKRDEYWIWHTRSNGCQLILLLPAVLMFIWITPSLSTRYISLKAQGSPLNMCLPIYLHFETQFFFCLTILFFLNIFVQICW